MIAPTPEILLAEADFVRALARSLLRDEAGAEDVAQQTYVAALRRPLPPLRSARAWLSRIVSNLAANERRAAGRRARRERVAARAELVPSTETVVQREQTRQLVVAAVLELAEPYRGVVLLRYFEGLAPAQIAERLQRPPATVRAQLHRAMAMLRDRLDREHDRRTWGLLLAPLAGLDEPAVAAGGLAAKTLAAAGALVLLGAGAWWLATGGPAAQELPVAAREPERPRNEPVDQVRIGPVRRAVAESTEVDASAAGRARRFAGLRGRLLGPDGLPAAGIAVELLEVEGLGFLLGTGATGGPLLASHATVSGADGTFGWSGLRPRGRFALRAGHGGDAGALQLVAATPGPDQVGELGDVRLTARGSVTGRVVGEDGSPIGGAEVLASELPAFLLAVVPLDRLDPTHGGLVVLPAPTDAELQRGSGYAARLRSFLGSEMLMQVVAPGPGRILLPVHAPAERRAVFDWLPVARARTDADGRFQLGGLTPGNLTLIARRDGTAPAVRAGIRIEAAQPRDAGTIQLAAGESAQGRIVDSGGRPVAGARVRIAPVPKLGMRGLALCVAEQRTDADGSFVAHGLPDGELLIAVQATRQDAWLTFGPDAVDADWQIELPAREDLTLVLRRPEGMQPVVEELRVAYGPALGELAPLVVDRELPVDGRFAIEPDGRLRIRDLLPGCYEIEVTLAGAAPARRIVRVPCAEPPDLAVAAGHDLQVEVADSRGAPVAGASLLLWPLAPSDAERSILPTDYELPRWNTLPRRLGQTGADGRLTAQRIAAGEYGLVVVEDQLGQTVQCVQVPGGPLRIQLEEPASISGTLRPGPESRSPTEYRVVAERDDPQSLPGMPWLEAQATPAADGSFQLLGLAPGNWTVTPRAALDRLDGLAAWVERIGAATLSWDLDLLAAERRRSIVLRAGQRRRVELLLDQDAGSARERGSVSGVVVTDDGSCAGLNVTIGPAGWSPDAKIATDAGGAFRFDSVAEGVHDLCLRTPDGLLLWQERIMVAAREELARTIRISTGSLIGTGTASQPIDWEGARVSARRTDVRGWGASTVRCAADGSFTFDRLPAGTYLLTLRGDRAYGSITDVEVRRGASGAPVSIPIEPRFVLTVRVTRPGSEGAMYLERSSAAGGGGRSTVIDALAENRTLRCGGLAPGKFDLRLLDSKLQPIGAKVEVELGTADREVELR